MSRVLYTSGRAIGLAGHPTYINASSSYYIDAVKRALVMLRNTKDDSKPLTILDVGCGKTCFIADEIKNDYLCILFGMDISAEEMDLNSTLNGRIVYDACNPNYQRDLGAHAKAFDLIISHTFLEHVSDPETMHRLLGFLLKDTGIIVHLYPTLFDRFLTLNHMLPDWVTKLILLILQPSRVETGKFPSFYKQCKAFSAGLQLKYKELGFHVLNYRNFCGTTYFCRFFPLQAVMDLFYFLILNLDVRLFASRSCVVLLKDNEGINREKPTNAR